MPHVRDCRVCEILPVRAKPTVAGGPKKGKGFQTTGWAACQSARRLLESFSRMKEGLHPQYHHDAKVTCACGNAFTTGSTISEIHVEICSNCHPFYTGKQKLIDTAGRVDRFKRIASLKKSGLESKTVKKAKRAAARKKAGPKAEEA